MKSYGIFYILAFVSDLERSKAFYRDKIGCKLSTDEPRVAGLALGEGYLVLHVDERDPKQRVPVSKLIDQPWGERNFTFTDPDGYVWLVAQSR